MRAISTPRIRRMLRQACSLALAGIVLLTGCQRNEDRTLADELDRIIEQRQTFNDKKEERISELKRMLDVTGLSPRQEYDINARLCDQYWKYNLDSAIRYAERNLWLARQMHDDEAARTTSLRLTQLYSFSGKSIEAKRILDTTRRATVSSALLPLYYETFTRYFEHYAVISNQNKYRRLRDRYNDSLLRVLTPGSYRYKASSGSQLIAQGRTEEAEALLLGLLEEVGENTPQYAEVAYELGGLYTRTGDAPQARKYYLLSAIADVRNATKENAAFHTLAQLYYADGDLARASRYTQAAIEDALFSNVQFRSAQMTKFYADINAAYQAKETQTKAELQHYLLLISVLTIVLILLFVYVYKQMQRLYRIQQELSQANARLTQLNDELNDKNALLSDSNRLKEQYIARFFDLCSLYIDKMDGYRKTLYKLAQSRQLDELFKRLRSTSMMESELDELYANFDAVFLNLYPTFVAEFNALLLPDERIELRPGDLLNKELRIYALLRLGISDSAKIAAFLRCSLSTVYNYRTKMRNKAAGARDEFEKRVMRIGESQEISA